MLSVFRSVVESFTWNYSTIIMFLCVFQLWLHVSCVVSMHVGHVKLFSKLPLITACYMTTCGTIDLASWMRVGCTRTNECLGNLSQFNCSCYDTVGLKSAPLVLSNRSIRTFAPWFFNEMMLEVKDNTNMESCLDIWHQLCCEKSSN